MGVSSAVHLEASKHNHELDPLLREMLFTLKTGLQTLVSCETKL
jgi:hypothetical protein